MPQRSTKGIEPVAQSAVTAFSWSHQGCFVELHPVQTGWLMVWGRREDGGRRKVAVGNRVYPTLCDARRRLADAVVELTHQRRLAAEALDLFEQTRFLPHRAPALPPPL